MQLAISAWQIFKLVTFFCNFNVFFIYFKVVSWCFAFGKCIWQLVFGKCRLVGICGNALQAGEWPRPLDSKLDLCLGHFQRMFTPVHHYSTLHYIALHYITLWVILAACLSLPTITPAPACTYLSPPAKSQSHKTSSCCYFRILKCRFPVSYAPSKPA